MENDPRRLHVELLAHAGRLLLEYNQSTRAIHRALRETARALADEPCHVDVSYGGLTVSVAGEAPLFLPVRELRYNTAVSPRPHDLRAVARARTRPGRGPGPFGRRIKIPSFGNSSCSTMAPSLSRCFAVGDLS